jgi:transcriptional regulator
MKNPSKVDLLVGTLDLLALKILANGPLHGYGIAKRLQELSDGQLLVEEGSLYPALYRMEKRGWITSQTRTSQNNRRARYYRVTLDGRKQLAEEERAWADFSEVVSKVLEGAR